jgi:S-adenosylmethionine:tRNA ribosyltransferase-isomerase
VDRFRPVRGGLGGVAGGERNHALLAGLRWSRRTRGAGVGALEARKPCVDGVPAGRDEIDEQSEVVDARVALGEDVLLEPLEPARNVVEQPADLGQLAAYGEHLAPKPVGDRRIDAVGQADLEVARRRGEGFDLCAGAFEHRLEANEIASFACSGDPLGHSLENEFVHGGQGYSGRRMRSADLDYELPPELIAQRPVEPRDASRLLVYDRASGEIRHRGFSDLPTELTTELAVVNDTRVVPARLRLRRESGGAVEILLVERLDDGLWEALARPSRKLRVGDRLGPVELVAALGEGRWRVRLAGEPAGEMPLPPYIRVPLEDPARYQTVFAAEAGSAAAPTAGLHFTPELLARLDVERVTLDVGLDTFRPLTADSLEEHVLHGERYRVERAAWERIEAAERVLAVGTTSVRVLETVARTGELAARTRLFVTPGFEFRRVDALLTNFHLPRSTLLALVMAFAGIEATRELYRVAIAESYRFYSFGDAMLIL